MQLAIGRLPVIHKTIRAVWTPPERVYRHLYFQGPIKVDVDPGKAFRIQSYGDAVENDLFWRGYGNGWESTSLRLWRDLVKRADIIADVGANTGVYALAAQALKPDAKVVAVEPSRRIYDRLRKNIALNGYSTQAVDSAASDQDGTATFYDSPGENSYSGSLEAGMLGAGTMPVEVRVERLDGMFARYGFDRLDLMKMDVEMHEPAALRGTIDIIRRCRPTMLIEVLNRKIEAEIREVLNGLDYVYTPVRERQAQEAGLDGHYDSLNMLICQRPVLDAFGPKPYFA